MWTVTARPAVLRPARAHAHSCEASSSSSPRLSRACPALISRLSRYVTRATSRSASPFTQRVKDVQKTELLGSPEQGRPKKLLLVSTSSRFAIRPFESANLDRQQAAGSQYKRAGKSSHPAERTQRAIRHHLSLSPLLSSLPLPVSLKLNCTCVCSN